MFYPVGQGATPTIKIDSSVYLEQQHLQELQPFVIVSKQGLGSAHNMMRVSILIIRSLVVFKVLHAAVKII